MPYLLSQMRHKGVEADRRSMFRGLPGRSSFCERRTAQPNQSRFAVKLKQALVHPNSLTYLNHMGVRSNLALATLAIGVSACATDQAPGYSGMTPAERTFVAQHLRANDLQIRQLAADIRTLRQDVCRVAVSVEKVEVQRDPNNGRNRVVARDGAARNPAMVCQ